MYPSDSFSQSLPPGKTAAEGDWEGDGDGVCEGVGVDAGSENGVGVTVGDGDGLTAAVDGPTPGGSVRGSRSAMATPATTAITTTAAAPSAGTNGRPPQRRRCSIAAVRARSRSVMSGSG